MALSEFINEQISRYIRDLTLISMHLLKNTPGSGFGILSPHKLSNCDSKLNDRTSVLLSTPVDGQICKLHVVHLAADEVQARHEFLRQSQHKLLNVHRGNLSFNLSSLSVGCMVSPYCRHRQDIFFSFYVFLPLSWPHRGMQKLAIRLGRESF